MTNGYISLTKGWWHHSCRIVAWGNGWRSWNQARAHERGSNLSLENPLVRTNLKPVLRRSWRKVLSTRSFLQVLIHQEETLQPCGHAHTEGCQQYRGSLTATSQVSFLGDRVHYSPWAHVLMYIKHTCMSLTHVLVQRSHIWWQFWHRFRRVL